MSQFVKHGPCPNCGSKDNLGLWDDGHRYCFGCSYMDWENGKSLNSIKIRVQNEGTKSDDSCRLPFDCTDDLPEVALEWLYFYDITDEEIYHYKLRWSERERRLYFPIYGDDGTLLICQGRYYGHDQKQPRYRTIGKSRDLLIILPNRLSTKNDLMRLYEDTVICCEDMVSAIKIARICNSWVLLGSNIAQESLKRTAKAFSRFGIWLDRDKAAYALKTRLSANLWFDEVFTIITDSDPKCYTTEEIEKWVSL